MARRSNEQGGRWESMRAAACLTMGAMIMIRDVGYGSFYGIAATLGLLLGLVAQAAEIRASVAGAPTSATPEIIAAVRDGMLYETEGNWGEAIESYEKAQACGPLAEPLRLTAACLQLRQGQIARAASSFETLLSLSRPRVSMRFRSAPLPAQWLGIRTERQIAEDIPSMQAMLAVHPGDWKLHYLLAFAYGNTGQFEGYFAEFYAAAQMERNCAEFHRGLAGLSMMRGKLQDAARHFADALAVDPHNIPSAHYLSLMLVGRKDLAGAEKILRQAVAGSDDANILVADLAMVLSMRGNRSAAADLLSRFMQPTPAGKASADISALQQASKVYLSLGDNKRSVELLEQALKLDADDPETRRLLGQARSDRASAQPDDRTKPSRSPASVKRPASRRTLPNPLKRFLVEHVGPAALFVHSAQRHMADGGAPMAAHDLRAALALSPHSNAIRFLLTRLHSDWIVIDAAEQLPESALLSKPDKVESAAYFDAMLDRLAANDIAYCQTLWQSMMDNILRAPATPAWEERARSLAQGTMPGWKIADWAVDRDPYGRDVCGAVAAAQVLRFHKTETSRFALAKRMGYLDGRKVSVWEIAQACVPDGYEGIVFVATPEVVKAVLQQGTPLIAARSVFWNAHYAAHASAVCGFDERVRVVLLNDPNEWQDQFIPYEEVADVLWIALVPKGAADSLPAEVHAGQSLAEQFTVQEQSALRDPDRLAQLLASENATWRAYPAITKLVATALLSARQADRAKGLLESVVTKNPLDGYAHYLLGGACLMSGQREQAMAHLEAALRLHPSYAAAAQAYAAAASKPQELERAADHLLHVLLLSPTDLESYYALGSVWMRQGSKEKAQAALKTYIDFASPHDAAKAQRLLERLASPTPAGSSS